MDFFDKLEKDLLLELRAVKLMRKTAFEAAMKTTKSGVDLGCSEGQKFESAALKTVKAELDMVKGIRNVISSYKEALDELIGAAEGVEQAVTDGRMSLIPKLRVKFSDSKENEAPISAMRHSIVGNSSALGAWSETPKAVKSALKKPKPILFAPSPILQEQNEDEDLDQTPTASESIVPPSKWTPKILAMPVLTMPQSPVLNNRTLPILNNFASVSSVSRMPVTPPTLSRPSPRSCLTHNTSSWTPKPLNFEDSIL